MSIMTFQSGAAVGRAGSHPGLCAIRSYLAGVAMLVLLAGCGPGGGGGEAASSTTPRPVSATCVAQDPPSTGMGGGGVRLQRVFANQVFDDSLALIQHPTNDDRWYVVRKSGQIETFLDTNPAGTRSTAVTVTVETFSEMGLLGMAFHPDFASNGLVFLSYVRPGPGVGVSAIGRYVSSNNGLTFSEDGNDHEILTLDQPAGNHNGGQIAFGPGDGFLYASFGDGGVRSQADRSQDLDNLYGTIIRIDVDNEPYSIPANNPFVGRAGRDEIWAYGFRNPWRFSFDSVTGDLWIGDVGQAEREEIDRIAAGDNSGDNFGWPLMEGSVCRDDPNCLSRGDLIDPVYDYGRGVGVSVIGGFVYRGSDLSGLSGVYIFGDFGNGQIWALLGANGNNPSTDELTSLQGQLVGFGQGRDGEIYVMDLGGRIFRLAPDGSGPVVDNFPTRLSDTGCFEPADPRQPVTGVVPYEVASPFWSDGAVKERFLSVPAGRSVTVDADGHFDFPIGTVLAKSFALGTRMVETRLFMRHDNGDWGGYSYEWDVAGRDATLVEGSKTVRINGVDWLFPGRADCFRCHTDVAGRSLGPEVAQLNFPIRHPDGQTENQVDRLLANGILRGPLPNLAPEDQLMPGLDEAGASAERRAKAYLHSNCAYCHQPGGPGSGPPDFRFQTATENMGICDVNPTRGDLGVSGSRILFPGEPNFSVLLLRMEDLGQNRMPNYASEIVHGEAVAVMRDWIDGLTACP